MKLENALDSFRRDAKARGLKRGTLSRYNDLWRIWLDQARKEGLLELEDWVPDALSRWRSTWTCAGSTHRLRISQLKTFFRFAVEVGWIERSPAALIRAPSNNRPPTPPLTASEARRFVLAAREASADTYAIALVMLYGGLAIRDAATLPRSAIAGSLLTLRRAKSGELVRVELPVPVLEALKAVARPGKRFFWTEESDPASVSKYWRGRLHEIAKAARIQGFHPHRLRHTFAVRLLSSGVVEMEHLATLMGHSSVQTTERYYAAWDPRRQDLLVRKVREANERDPLLEELAELK